MDAKMKVNYKISHQDQKCRYGNTQSNQKHDNKQVGVKLQNSYLIHWKNNGVDNKQAKVYNNANCRVVSHLVYLLSSEKCYNIMMLLYEGQLYVQVFIAGL